MVRKASDERDGRLAVSIADAAGMIGMSINFVRNEIGAGHLKVARLGKRVLILRAELDRYLAAASVERVAR